MPKTLCSKPTTHGNFSPYAPRTTHHAFSLVELSIVLVILGLLVGGVLSGKSLIRAAQFRAYTTQYKNFYTATYAFRDKYMALPGDMTNATQFWGLQLAGVGCMASASTDNKTCDGDGNGRIDSSTTSYEQYRFWQHLGASGLIEGKYNGTAQAPQSKLTDSTTSGWYTNYQGIITADVDELFFDGDYGNILTSSNRFIPEEVYNIDTKIDDGKPATGKILIFSILNPLTSGDCTVAASTADSNATYLLSSNTRACRFYFRQQF